jgi:SHS2 domain-containing protein
MIDDLTSDVMFEAYGKDLRELFENAAEAMFSVICTIGKVKARKSVSVKSEADNAEGLMVKWLQELIALVDTEGMFFSKFQVLEISENRLKARVYGEEMNPGMGLTVVKAVTYYKLRVQNTKTGWKARISLDV